MSGGQHRNRSQRRAKAQAGSSSFTPAASQQPAPAPLPFPMPMPPHTRQESGYGVQGGQGGPGWRATPPTSAHHTHTFSQQPGSVSLPPGAFPGAYPFWPQPPGAFSPTPHNMPTNIGPRHVQRESTHSSKRQRYQGDAPIGIGHPQHAQHPSLANVTNIDHRSNPSATLRNRANLAILTDIPLSAGAGPISPAINRPLNTPQGPPPGTPLALLPYNQRAFTVDSAGLQSLGHFPHSSLSLPIGSPLSRQGPPGPLGLGPGSPIPPPSPITRRAVTQPSQLSQSHTRSASTQQRLGPPPKAILGGPGGRTFDELRPSPGSLLKPTPAPSATSRSSSPLAAGAQRNSSGTSAPGSDNEGSGNEAATKAAAVAAIKDAVMHNGNPVHIALPPGKYSPPDTPASAMTTEKQDGGESKVAEPAAERVPRKEAFPWPQMQVGTTPHSIPLPLSPISDNLSEVEKAFSPQIATPPAKYKVVTWMGKGVRVTMPEEGGWSAPRPPSSMEVDDNPDDDDKRPSMDVDDEDIKPTENVDTTMTEHNARSPTSSPRMDNHPSTPPTETSMHTSPPGSSQWETAFESSSLSNSPPAFTAWEGPRTRSVTPSEDGKHPRVSPIAEEYGDGEQLEQASDKTETASATSEANANTLAMPGGLGVTDDISPGTAKPPLRKLYSEEGGPVERPEEHAALREVVLGSETPTPAVEGAENTGQTVVLDRLMSGIASPMPSPFRKSFAGLAANPFLKRSLGGMLRPTRTRRGSDTVPPTPTRLTQSTTADEPANNGSQTADTGPSEVPTEDAQVRNVGKVYRLDPSSTTPPAQDSEQATIISPRSDQSSPPPRQFTLPPPIQFAQPQRQIASPPHRVISPQRGFGSPPQLHQFSPQFSQHSFASPTRQPLSPPEVAPPPQFASPTRQPMSPIDEQRQFASPTRQPRTPPVDQQRNIASPTRQPLSPPFEKSARQFTPPSQAASPFRETSSPRSTPSPSSFQVAKHTNQASIDRAMASDSLAEAIAAMAVVEAPPAPPAAPAPRPRVPEAPSSRIPQAPGATTHWSFVARRPSAVSTQEQPVKPATPTAPEQVSDDNPLSWRSRSKSASPALHRDLQQLIRPDSGALKTSEKTRQDEGDDHEPVTSADEELKGDADATTLLERPRTGAAGSRESRRPSQRGLQLQGTSAITNEDDDDASSPCPSSPIVSSSIPISRIVHTSAPSKSITSSSVCSFPNVPTDSQNQPAQPGGLSPPKRLQATSASFVPRTTLSVSSEPHPFNNPEPHLPFMMGHTPKTSDASSTFIFGPPSAQPSPTKPHKRIASAGGRLRPTVFETPADADPMPQESNALGNNALNLFSFTHPGKLRPTAIEFKPIGLAQKPRISPCSGFRPPALDLSAAAPSSRAFASFSTGKLGKPFEFQPAIVKPALVIRKPNPIPILKPKEVESPTAKPALSPHRQSASPWHDETDLVEQSVPSEGATDGATGEPRDEPRRGKHTAKRSSRNSHLARAWLERSQPSTPVANLSEDVQIHQSRPLRLVNAVGHMVRSSSDGALLGTQAFRLPGSTETFSPTHHVPSELGPGGESTRPNATTRTNANGSTTVTMNRKVSAPSILSAKAKSFVPLTKATVNDSARRLEAFLHHTPHSSNVNPEVADENKFRQWVFPHPESHSRSPSAGSHSLHPSLSLTHKRRHSETEEDAEADDETGSGDASGARDHNTTADEVRTWPNWPHGTEVLSPESHSFTATDTSAEFPMRRSPPRRLSVINTITPPRPTSLDNGGIISPIVLPREMLVGMLTTMKDVGEQVMQSRSDHQRLLEESTKRAEAAATQNTVASATLDMIKEYFSNAPRRPSSGSVATILEAHTELLRGHTVILQEIQQKIEDETRTSTADSTELADRTLVTDAATNSHEMLTAILSGQHAMMSKFGEYTEAHEAVYDLRSATDALLEAQADARQVKIDQQHGHELVRLHDELRDESAKTTQAEREVAALQAKLDAAEKAAKSRELEDVWRALIRADVAAATSALAKATRSEEHAREELTDMREQLAKQNTAHQAAIEGVKQERDATAKLAEERHMELAEQAAAIDAFRSKLLERLDGLGHSFERELGKKRSDAEVEREALARERNGILEKEVHDLREQLNQSANERSDLRVQLTQAVADVRFEQEKAIRMADTEAHAKRTLELQLKAEKARATYLETKMQRAEADVTEVAGNLDAWRSAALEQRMRAEQATTHVTALQQENFHWRQFALGADRHRLEQWLATKPFEGVDANASNAKSPVKTTTPARPGSPACSVSPPAMSPNAGRPPSPVKNNTAPAVSSKLRMVVPVINEPDGAKQSCGGARKEDIR